MTELMAHPNFRHCQGKQMDNSKSKVKKPLVWDKIRMSERFKFLNSTSSKVLHVVVDDVLAEMEDSNEGIFSIERLQNKVGVERVKDWMEINSNVIEDDDIFIDAPSSNRNVYLKYEVSMLLKYLMIKV